MDRGARPVEGQHWFPVGEGVQPLELAAVKGGEAEPALQSDGFEEEEQNRMRMG